MATRGGGHHRTKQFQPLSHHFTCKKIDSGEVASRSVEAGDKTSFYWIVADAEDYRDRRGCCLCCKRRSGTGARHDDGDPPSNQVGCEFGQASQLIVGPAVYDRYVLALN
jgi:hypothetical protein